MATDKMYESAFRYKRTKLWKNMQDTEVFAVRFSDGEIGYCCVMGLLGEHIALAVYVGDEGFQSFREMAFREELDFSDDDEFSPSVFDANWAFRQVCLQCSFENREELDEWDAENVRKYAKAHKIQLRGAHSFPNFSKYMRYRVPCGIGEPEDERRICEALDAASALAELLETRRKSDIGLYPIDEDTETLPLLVPGKDGYTVSSTKVPEPWEEEWREPPETDAESVAELRKLRKKGVYACEVLRLPGLLEEQGESDEAPYFPALLLCVETKSGYIVSMNPAADYETRPESLRDAFIQALIQSKMCPRAIKARNEEVRVLLSDLCVKTGILLSVDENLPALDDAKEELSRMLNMGDGFLDDNEDDEDDEEYGDVGDMDEAISFVMDEMMRMSDKDLKTLPREVVRQILDMAPFGFVPKELQLRLRRLFK